MANAQKRKVSLLNSEKNVQQFIAQNLTRTGAGIASKIANVSWNLKLEFSCRFQSSQTIEFFNSWLEQKVAGSLSLRKIGIWFICSARTLDSALPIHARLFRSRLLIEDLEDSAQNLAEVLSFFLPPALKKPSPGGRSAVLLGTAASPEKTPTSLLSSFRMFTVQCL